VEYGPKGVRAFALLPGVIETDLWDFEVTATSGVLNISPEEVKKIYTDATPLRCFGIPLDVANLVAFLCSDESSFLTGLSIPVAGGLDISNPISEI